MPKKNGIEATACIKARFPRRSSSDSRQAGEEARRAILNAGGAVLLTKEAAVDELYRTIREVLDAQLPMAAVKALPRSAESDTRRARSVSCSGVQANHEQ